MRSHPQAPAPSAPRSLWADYYVAAWGFSLVPVPAGSKGPRRPGWNLPGGYFDDADEARSHWRKQPYDNMGVLLNASGLATLDVDEAFWARQACRKIGLELDEILAGAVRVAGQACREKAFFLLPENLTLEHRVLRWPSPVEARSVTVFELRAGGVQDLLPPSIHPATKKPYRWLYAPWQRGEIPTLPEPLLRLWQAWDDLRPELEAACPFAELREPVSEPSTGAETQALGPGPGPWDEVRHHIKQQLSLHSMLEELGAVRRGGGYLCPFHEETRPSFWTFDTGRGYSLWVDAHGNAPVGRSTLQGYSIGDVIDLYQALHGLPSPGKATVELARALGLLPGLLPLAAG